MILHHFHFAFSIQSNKERHHASNLRNNEGIEDCDSTRFEGTIDTTDTTQAEREEKEETSSNHSYLSQQDGPGRRFGGH